MSGTPVSGGHPGSGGHRGESGEHEPPVVRDKRRIDPMTGALRPTAEHRAAEQLGTAGPGDDAGPGPEAGPDAARLAEELAERTGDLQRVQAEYLNYRRRVSRDADAVREAATATALTALLPVLDDIGRARAHGELSGGFKAVAESLESAVARLGLVGFGEAGEAFDPAVHEALMHEESTDVAADTCVAVLAPGYRLGEKVLRPARVAVASPVPGSVGGTSSSATEQDDPWGADSSAERLM